MFESGLPLAGSSKVVSCVACHWFCSYSAACSIVLNVAVPFEQKLKTKIVYWFGYAACSLSLSQIVAIFLIISVTCRRFENGLSPHVQTVSTGCRPKPLEGHSSLW